MDERDTVPAPPEDHASAAPRPADGPTAAANAVDLTAAHAPAPRPSAVTPPLPLPPHAQTDGAPSTDTMHPVEPSRPQRKQWSLATKILTGVVSGVSFVTGIIAVIPILTRDVTNYDALTVEAAPYPATATEYAVPIDAAFERLPGGSGRTRSAEQRAWLESNGTEIHTRVILDMRNTAREGAMLAVKDFRVAGDREPDAADAVRVVCDTNPPTSVRVQAARLDATDDRNVAVFAAAAFGVATEGLPDSPAAWNLAPGETGQFIIRMRAEVPVDGELEATMIAGGETRATSIDLPVVIRPVLAGGDVYLRVGEGLDCVDERGPDTVECDVDGLLSR